MEELENNVKEFWEGLRRADKEIEKMKNEFKETAKTAIEKIDNEFIKDNLKKLFKLD